MIEQVNNKAIQKMENLARQITWAGSAPAPAQRYRLGLYPAMLIMFAAIFGILTYLVKTSPSFAIDLQITRAIQLIDLPFFGFLMSAVSWPGFSLQAVIITSMILVLTYGLGLHWEALVGLAAAALSAGINMLAKGLIQRPRPTTDMVNVIEKLNTYSFPSGHVMYYLVFFGFIGFLIFFLMKPSIKRSLLLTLLGIFIGLIGISRIYLGDHWASDVLGAYLLGGLTLAATIKLYGWGKAHFSFTRRQQKFELSNPLRKR